MNKLFDLENKIIAITGGYGYLGAVISAGLLDFGATVWILARDEKKFENIFKNHNINHEKLFFRFCDISNIGSIRDAFKFIYQTTGCLNVLINNAFYMDGRDNKNVMYSDWESGIEGILSSTFWCINEAVPYLKKSDNSRIINVSSTHGMLAIEKDMLKPPQYSIAKAGVIQLTKYYASFLGQHNITVNTITPGSFPSSDIQKMNAKYIRKLADRTMLKRIGYPEELTGGFIFLCSNASNYITGHNLIIDGGITAS